MQRTVYNGQKRVHTIKSQIIATPNGLVANIYGPVESRFYDGRTHAYLDILFLLQQYWTNQTGNQLCIYGGLFYPLRTQLQAPFNNPQLNLQQATIPWAKKKLMLSGFLKTLETF